MLRAAVMLGRSLLSCDPAPHTLRYIHGFARIEIAQKRRCFVVPLITRRAISNQILLILLILSKTSTRSTCSTRLTIFSFVYLVYFVVHISLRTLRPCASALNFTHQTPKLKVACFFTAASPRRLVTTLGLWQMRKGFPHRPGLVALRRRAMRKPLSFPHLPFASYSNPPLALRRGLEDRRLDSARRRQATSPGPRLMPTDRTAKPKSPTVVCAQRK